MLLRWSWRAIAVKLRAPHYASAGALSLTTAGFKERLGYVVSMKAKRRRAARKDVPPWITNPPPERDYVVSVRDCRPWDWLDSLTALAAIHGARAEREAGREVDAAVRVALSMGLLDFVVLALGVIWCEWWHCEHRVDDF